MRQSRIRTGSPRRGRWGDRVHLPGAASWLRRMRFVAGACLTAILLVSGGAPALAQDAGGATYIAGVVTGPDGKPLPDAQVTARPSAGGLAVSARTDAAGRYHLDVRGEHVVTVEKEGYVAATALVLAGPAPHNVRLTAAEERGYTLDPLLVQAPARAPVPVRRGESPGSGLSSLSGHSAAAYPGDPGDLAGSSGISGQYVPSGAGAISVSGQPPSGNRVTVDGAGFDASSLPPEAMAAAGVLAHPYDVSRGQFTGGEIAGRTLSGTNLWGGVFRTSIQHPSLQYAGPAGASGAAGPLWAQVGGGGGGPLVRGRLFVYGAVQATTRSSFSSPLDPAGAEALRYGISPDSLRRFLQLIRGFGIGEGAGGERRTHAASTIARIDFLPGANHTATLRLDGRARRSDGALGSPLAITSGGRDEGKDGGVFAQLVSRMGRAGNDLTVYRSGGTQRSLRTYEGPTGRLWLGQDTGVGGTLVSFGAAPFSIPDEDRSALEAAERFTLSLNGGHQILLGGAYQAERVVRRGAADASGTFTFASLAELEAGRAQRFTRSLGGQTGEMSSDYAAIF
ncbi:MAG TPA: carboxypeptidase-like regulatory domain-containing protein, partial [Longimicrobium sp.]